MTRAELIERRTFLRGLGTAIALPWMASSLPRPLWASGSSGGAAPLRMAFFFIPNGAHMPAWTPTAEGESFELPATLAPLEPWRKKLLVLSGLAHDTGFAHGDGAGDHARSAATFLTGVHPVKTDGKGIRAGISVDQLAAAHLGRDTQFASLELGCEEGRLAGDCDSGYSCAYSNNISWRSPTLPAGKEVNPRRLFDRLFGAGDADQQAESRAIRDEKRKSVLDLVAEDARRMRRRLSGNDRQKLDEYLTGLRQIERRIETAGTEEERSASGRLKRPEGVPEKFSEHAALMADLLATAFETDATRVASFMMANEGSVKRYPEIEVTEGHHDLSHHQGKEDKQAKIAKINRLHIEQFARFVGRLESIREGEGTLLDNTLIVYGGGIADGNSHNHNDLPVILMGGAAAGVHGGRHVRYPQNTPLMNLYLLMLQKAGVKVTAVGDSSGPLPDVSGV